MIQVESCNWGRGGGTGEPRKWCHEIRVCQVNEIHEQIATTRKELTGYIGPVAFGALIAAPP
jgi:hypothetical protein